MAICAFLWTLPPGSPLWEALLLGCRNSQTSCMGITQEIFPRVAASSSSAYNNPSHLNSPATFIYCSNRLQVSSCPISPYREGIKQKICLLERQQGTPRKITTQPYPQTRWDFPILSYRDTMQSLCIDYKDTRCNT